MSEQFEGRVLRNSKESYTVRVRDYVTGDCRCPNTDACEGSINQYYYMPEPQWRNMFVCGYHGSLLAEGWVKV